MNLKRIQSFSIYGTARQDNGEPMDLTGYTLTSQIESDGDKTDLEAVVISAVDGLFRLDGSAVSLGVGSCKFDVRFSNGPIVDYSQTEKIDIDMAITQ